MAGDKVTSFRAPREECDAEFTEKRSRFIGSVRVALSAGEAAETIKKFPEIYPKANHHCWGYRIGADAPLEHCSDAGEPAGTAGRPILGVIKRYDLTNTLIVVTRYFGGVKLGVRGLIDAYKRAAELAIEQAGVVEMEFHNALLLRCGYGFSKTLLATLKKQGFGDGRVNAEYGADVVLRLEVPLSMRGTLAPPLAELLARGLLTECLWDDTPLAREKRR